MQLFCGIMLCSLGKALESKSAKAAAMQTLQICSAGLQAAYCCCQHTSFGAPASLLQK